MKVHSVYGISAPEKGWVPSPRYLLRRNRVLRLLAQVRQGRLLEIGCGAGALLHDMACRGFDALGLEQSDAAGELARYMNSAFPGVQVFTVPQDGWRGSFDIVLALEVLEHIQDDASALREWRSWLKPRGHLLLSVPAHRSHWSATDVWAGHVRRYERYELLQLLRDQEFFIIAAECYGFPLANMLGPLRARYHARQLKGHSGQNRVDFTGRSGIERNLETRLYPLQASWVGTFIMQCCFALQTLFLKTNLGNGFLLLCKRS